MLPDERILAGFEIMAAPTTELLRYLYPQLYTVSDPGGEWGRPTTSGRYNPQSHLLIIHYRADSVRQGPSAKPMALH